MKAWVFDVETTDLDDDRQIIEAAWIVPRGRNDLTGPSDLIDRPLHGIEYCERFCPTKPISYGSMAIHNILPHELHGKPDPSTFEIPGDVEYIIGHNIDFDWISAGSPDVKRICTDAMARHTWPDAGSYSQSALIYMLCGATEETRDMLKNAHSALDDVRNCVVLLQAIIVAKNISTWGELYKYSEECRIPLTCPFQKYRDVPLTKLAKMDFGYCQWMLDQAWLDPYLRTGVRRALGYE